MPGPSKPAPRCESRGTAFVRRAALRSPDAWIVGGPRIAPGAIFPRSGRGREPPIADAFQIIRKDPSLMAAAEASGSIARAFSSLICRGLRKPASRGLQARVGARLSRQGRAGHSRPQYCQVTVLVGGPACSRRHRRHRQMATSQGRGRVQRCNPRRKASGQLVEHGATDLPDARG